MPQDAFTLLHTAKELNNLLTGAKVNRVVQPDKDDVYLAVYTGAGARTLVLSSNAEYCRVAFTSAEKPKPQVAPSFCMLLRKHLLGAYWQSNGITVIPTISWSDESSFDWCFDGEPVGGAVAVSSVGTQMNATARALFLAGYKEMLERLQPSQILFYGSIPAECSGDKIIPILTFQDGLKRRVSKKFTQDEGNSQEDVL